MSIAAPEPKQPIFKENSWGLKICLLVMFLLATLVRLNDIRTPGHLLDREYTSAIFARAYYFQNNPAVEDWRREIAVITKDQQPVLEPPVVEYLVSWIYRIMGREEIFYSRFLTNAFWLVGGFFMYLITKKLLSTDEAVIATAYYLFVPMGIIISRSFQPDSLMMLLFLISLYLVIGYFETLSMKHLLLAAAVTSVTLLLRPLVLFSIFCAFLALSIYRNKGWRKLFNAPLFIFGGISLLPAAMYYGYGIVFAGFMRWKISTSFMSYLLVKKDFWLGWFELGLEVAGYTAVLAAVIGFFFLRNKMAQYLVAGLAVGYVIFGIAFTYHTHTHPYYHVQLFPIIALCIAALLVTIIQSLRKLNERVWLIPASAVLLIVFYFTYQQVHDNLYRYHMEDPAVAAEIGEIVHHSPHTVYVARYYGLPLAYYGEFGGAPWPVRIEEAFYRRPGEQELSVKERIDGLGFIPEYYVITNFDLYNRKHQDLKTYLEQDCLLLAHKDQYLIYSSCKAAAGE